MDKRSLGKFIADKRKEQHLTQKDLANHLLVSTTAISKWERGVNLPDIELWEKIAEVLHVTLNKPLEGELIFLGNIIPPNLLYWSEKLNDSTYAGSLRLGIFNYSSTDNKTYSYYKGCTYTD